MEVRKIIAVFKYIEICPSPKAELPGYLCWPYLNNEFKGQNNFGFFLFSLDEKQSNGENKTI